MTCAGIFLAAGCDPDPVEEDLEFQLGGGGTLVLDSDCSGGCGGDVLVEVELSYTDDQRLDDELVEFEQYRVDYVLDGVDEEVPFYAGRQGILLAPGQDAAFTLVIVGERQREFVRERGEADGASGTATLTLAGYDSQNAQVFIEETFEVRFSDLAPNSASGTGARIEADREPESEPDPEPEPEAGAGAGAGAGTEDSRDSEADDASE